MDVASVSKITRCVVVTFAYLVLAGSCEQHDSNGVPKIVYASETDFQDATDVAPVLAEGLEISLWAPGPLLANAVSISMDPSGAAYISETQRRQSSDLDIRRHRDWMISDLALHTLKQTEEFHLTTLAPEHSESNSWLEDFNGDGLHDWRDLTVQTEYIRKIWDSDGDGRADASIQYADGFNKMLTGVAAGVMYHDDYVYLTAAPDVYKLKDLDGDGDADERQVISHGFGVHIAYAGHDMSGLTMGPDGKIYWSVGDIGVDAYDEHGKLYSYPHHGAVMRCNPDGSEFEVFAHGLRNPQEIAFDAYGNLISVDNDGDHPGEHERYVHILEGSDSGWRTYWQFGKYNQPNEQYKVWIDEKLHLPHFKGQAAYIIPPLDLAPDGPAGLVYQPGTAFNRQWDNFFFGSYFKGSSAKSQIQAFRLEPEGASFRVAETRDVISGIVSTGIDFGPDGALYINDWLETYDKKSEGRIWRLDVADKDQGQRAETKQLLAAGVRSKSLVDLQQLLAHPDMRIRLNAQYEIARRGKQKSFIEVLQSVDSELARLHAIWGMGQLARKKPGIGKYLMPFLTHEMDEVRAQTAKVLGDARYHAAGNELIKLLNDPSDRVKFFAAQALGKLGTKSAFLPMVDLLERYGDADPHLRHGLIYSLSQLDMEQELADLATHSSAQVRIGAVVALRRIQSEKLPGFLNDHDTLVRLEAARAIHDDRSVPAALPDLAKSLTATNITNEAYLRRAINANLRLGDRASAQRLAQFSINPKAPINMRKDALWSLGYWSDPPELDRVEGCYRKLLDRPLTDAQEAFSMVVDQLMMDQDQHLLTAAIEAMGRLKYRRSEAELVRLCKDKSQPLAVRRAALESLATMQSASMQEVLNTSLEDNHLEMRTDAQALIAAFDLSPSVKVKMLEKVISQASIPEKQQAIASLTSIDHPEAEAQLAKLLEELINKKVDPSLQLDIIMAIEKSRSQELKDRLAAFESGRANEVPLSRFTETLEGGDYDRGRQIFFNDNSAQCIRCHRLGSSGGDVGPNLEGIATNLDNPSLLKAMIDPSDRLAPGYGTVTLELNDGSKVVGVIEEDSPEQVRIRNADGKSQFFSREQVKSKTYFPSSMPSMEQVLSKAEIRDLMAFLAGQK